MQHVAQPRRWRPPWYLWLFTPVAVLLTLPVTIPLALFFILPMSYMWLYPERILYRADVDGTPKERARLARLRAAYARLSLAGRR